MKFSIVPLMLVVLARTATAQMGDNIVEYFRDPEQKWTVQLPLTGTAFGPRVGKGNAVTVSPDGSTVYITLDNGRLEVLSAFDGARRWGYEPTPIFPGGTINCSSGVSFGARGSDRFLIHTEIHTPFAGSAEDVQSRLVAVSHPGNRVMWSTIVPGEVQGSPIVTSGDRFGGEYIFFTHNQNIMSEEPVGSFSMVIAETGALIWTEIAGDSRNDPDPSNLIRLDTLRAPYGPLGTAANPGTGRYPGGEGNIQDIFVWSTSILDGRGPNGYTRAFQLTRLFQPAFVDQLATVFLKENRWNAIASPTLSDDGSLLIFGVRANNVRGWTGVLDFNLGANVVVTLDEDPSEPRNAIPYSPQFSPSESNFFVSTTVGTMYSLATSNGEVIWDATFDSPVSASVQVSQDGAYLYYTTESGIVAAMEQDTGNEAWSITCEDIVDEDGTACADIIEAESSLAPSGLVYFYSDVLGNVKALQLGEFTFDTIQPTTFPTFEPTEPVTSSPTGSPSEPPTQTPTTSPTTSSPTGAPTASPAPTLSDFSLAPSTQPSNTPTVSPTMIPTVSASTTPTSSPTATPSEAPSRLPTSKSPTPAPTESPVDAPSEEPNTSSGACIALGIVGLLAIVIAFV